MKKVLIALLISLLLVGCGELENLTGIEESSISEELTDLETVTIDRVIDGDTVKVILETEESERIRLLLIDTPESVHSEIEPQPYGEEASEFAKSVLKKGQTVELERGNPERDTYDRLLAYIWIDDDVNFNQLMIEEGFARVAYVYEPNTMYLDEFEKAEMKAKEDGKNIWSIDGYVESQFEDY